MIGHRSHASQTPETRRELVTTSFSMWFVLVRCSDVPTVAPSTSFLYISSFFVFGFVQAVSSVLVLNLFFLFLRTKLSLKPLLSSSSLPCKQTETNCQTVLDATRKSTCIVCAGWPQICTIRIPSKENPRMRADYKLQWVPRSMFQRAPHCREARCSLPPVSPTVLVHACVAPIRSKTLQMKMEPVTDSHTMRSPHSPKSKQQQQSLTKRTHQMQWSPSNLKTNKRCGVACRQQKHKRCD